MNNTPEKKCSVCSRKFSLSKNPNGLVFEDEHFICEDCCNNKIEENFEDFNKSVMRTDNNGMPIALWLIHEQNKDKTMMSSKK